MSEKAIYEERKRKAKLNKLLRVKKRQRSFYQDVKK
tara:strand:+ start:1518 stop:1625 length:108 start_codon:yes stop_codon:yes gene_type:complete